MIHSHANGVLQARRQISGQEAAPAAPDVAIKFAGGHEMSPEMRERAFVWFMA